MAVSANSYGTAAGVAGYVRVYTNNGAFDTTTNPTLANVEAWINQISALVNAALASYRFDTPVTQADCVLMLTGVVEQYTSDLCYAARSTGRFFSERSLNSKAGIMGQIKNEIYDWLADNATGMENLGATRSADDSGSGEAVFGTIGLNFGARGDDPGIVS
jgi:hypothetical protein